MVRDAARSGSPDAYAELARLYIDGRLTTPHPKKAATYLEQGIAAGSAEAFFLKGATLLDQGDASSALDYLQQAAETNNPNAQRLLARLYERGDVVPRDLATAEAFARAAAATGAANAQVEAAQFLLKHGSVQSSPSATAHESAALFYQAEAQSDSRASLELAKLSLQAPQLKAEDVLSAHQYAKDAYIRGNPQATFALAATLGDGNGAEARDWLNEGAALNDWRSKYALALSAHSGLTPAVRKYRALGN